MKNVVSKDYLLKCKGEITLKFANKPFKVSCGHCPFYEDCARFRNELRYTKSDENEELSGV